MENTFRMYLMAMARANAAGHAVFEPGELQTVLAACRETIHRMKRDLHQAGLLTENTGGMTCVWVKFEIPGEIAVQEESVPVRMNERWRSPRDYCPVHEQTKFMPWPGNTSGPGRTLKMDRAARELVRSLHAATGGKCPLCGTNFDKKNRLPVVDHNHECCPSGQACVRCIRGVICKKHNTGLGYFDDDPQTLRAAADYIERNQLKAVA